MAEWGGEQGLQGRRRREKRARGDERGAVKVTPTATAQQQRPRGTEEKRGYNLPYKGLKCPLSVEMRHSFESPSRLSFFFALSLSLSLSLSRVVPSARRLVVGSSSSRAGERLG